jgi:hypothetical protein
MAIPSGLSNQLGYAQQGAYETVATVTRFLEFESEGLAVDKRVLRTRPANRLHQPANRSRHYIRGGGGPISIPFMNVGMGLLLKHALGGVATAQVGATAEYRHTFTPAADGGFGDWLTFQKGLADNTGTVRPFNFVGSKILSWRMVQAIDANGHGPGVGIISGRSGPPVIHRRDDHRRWRRHLRPQPGVWRATVARCGAHLPRQHQARAGGER